MAKATEAITQEAGEMTATAEKPTATEETKNQNPTAPVDFATRIAELEAQYQAQQEAAKERIESLKKDKKSLEAKALQLENQYRGLQKEFTPKLQEAAELRKKAAANDQMMTEISELRATLELIGRRVLDESEVEQLTNAQKQARLEAENRVLKAQVENPRPAEVNNSLATPLTLTEQRKQFLDYYFEGSKIDPNDPAIDWAEDVARTNPNEAMRRINSSILKVVAKRERKALRAQEAEPQPTEAVPTVDFQAELERIKAEALRAAQEEATKQARKETEESLRKMGIDAGRTPTSEGTRTFRAELNEELDDSLLTKGQPGSRERKEAVEEYNRRLANVRSRRGF